jgi:hypothetical protein
MAKKNNQDDYSSQRGGEMNEAKRAVLDKALGDIVKRYGEGSIMRLGETHSLEVEAIPTGSLSWILHSVSVASPGDGSLRSSDRNPRARPPSASTSPPKLSNWVGRWPSLIWNTPWIRLTRPVWE